MAPAEEGSWRHLGRCHTVEVERVVAAAEGDGGGGDGGRRWRLWACLLRSCWFC